jgi:hypothetical protein
VVLDPVGQDDPMTRSLRVPTLLASASLVASLILVGCGDDGDSSSSSTTEAEQTTTTTEASTSTSTTLADTTTTTAAPVAEQPEAAVWPFVADDLRFDDPAEAARSFVVDYLGFADPVVEPFQQGDSRSGEVPVRPADQGPITTVLVRQVTDDDTWWVIGAVNEHLQVTAPEAMAVVGPPLAIAGQSTAFEATFTAEVRDDGSIEPLVIEPVMGGSMGEMGPFSAELSFESPNEGGGALVLSTQSMEDGSTWEASVVRISFG